MLQFYFLSILVNLLIGAILVFSPPAQNTEEENTHSLTHLIFENKTFQLILGILTVFISIMKLLSVVPSDVPVIGDLIPAVAGLLGGFYLLLSYYLAHTTTEVTLHPLMQKVLDSKKYIGIICLAAALLHFLFPKVLFL
ncbi:MAG: hypothetical protein E7062_00845 [Spirochaetaceae bacterium]|nr:hypothetical protein [Spirochaetaceae bacterium]